MQQEKARWIRVFVTNVYILVKGDTYPIRHQLKKLGFVWDVEERGWKLSAVSAAQRKMNIDLQRLYSLLDELKQLAESTSIVTERWYETVDDMLIKFVEFVETAKKWPCCRDE